MRKPPVVRSSVGMLVLFTAVLGSLTGCGPEEESGSTHDMSAVEEVPVNEDVAEPEEPCTTDTWENYGEEFFTNTCVQCHTRLANYERVKLRAQKLATFIEDDRMPKTGPLPAAEKARVLKFLRCGAPEF